MIYHHFATTIVNAANGLLLLSTLSFRHWNLDARWSHWRQVALLCGWPVKGNSALLPAHGLSKEAGGVSGLSQ